jgi:hypothetical protein
MELDKQEIFTSGPAMALRPGLTFVWDIFSIPSGGAGSVTVRGRIPADISAANALWRVTGRVGASWADPSLTNNVADTVVVTVLILDRFEEDNTGATAQRVTAPLPPQAHTFHEPSDQDWVVFRARAGVTYIIRAVGLSGDSDMLLSLWNAQGVVLAKNDSTQPTVGFTEFSWQAPADGDYYIMAAGYTSPYGASYELEIRPQHRHFLPWVS